MGFTPWVSTPDLTTVGVGDLSARPAAARAAANAAGTAWGYGRELFAAFRHVVTTAEEGATVCFAFPSARLSACAFLASPSAVVTIMMDFLAPLMRVSIWL